MEAGALKQLVRMVLQMWLCRYQSPGVKTDTVVHICNPSTSTEMGARGRRIVAHWPASLENTAQLQRQQQLYLNKVEVRNDS